MNIKILNISPLVDGEMVFKREAYPTCFSGENTYTPSAGSEMLLPARSTLCVVDKADEIDEEDFDDALPLTPLPAELGAASIERADLFEAVADFRWANQWDRVGFLEGIERASLLKDVSGEVLECFKISSNCLFLPTAETQLKVTERGRRIVFSTRWSFRYVSNKDENNGDQAAGQEPSEG